MLSALIRRLGMRRTAPREDALPPEDGHGSAPLAVDEDSLPESLLAGTQLGEGGFRELRFHEVADLEDYRAYRRRAAGAYAARRRVEELLAIPQRAFSYRGFNALVGKPASFQVDYVSSFETFDGLALPNYRERLVCSETGLNSRMRGSLLALRYLLGPADLPSLRVYLTEQTTGFFAFVRALHPGVIGSEYLGPELAPGEGRGGLRHEDVTRLSFPDGAFDVVFCNDVLEHVPGYLAAISELARVVAPGGVLVLTVPFAADRHEHDLRARLRPDGSIEHLQPPVYHGDPVHPESGILCYQVFGWIVLEELRAAGFRRAGGLLAWSVYHGLMGGQDLLVLYGRR